MSYNDMMTGLCLGLRFHETQGFLFYFCHMQICTELKGEAMGPKLLRHKKRKEKN